MTREDLSEILIYFLAVLLVAVVLGLLGCITVDKSVHIHLFADKVDKVETRVSNRSDTKADGNSASAEADLNLPLVP